MANANRSVYTNPLPELLIFNIIRNDGGTNVFEFHPPETVYYKVQGEYFRYIPIKERTILLRIFNEWGGNFAMGKNPMLPAHYIEMDLEEDGRLHNLKYSKMYLIYGLLILFLMAGGCFFSIKLYKIKNKQWIGVSD